MNWILTEEIYILIGSILIIELYNNYRNAKDTTILPTFGRAIPTGRPTGIKNILEYIMIIILESGSKISNNILLELISLFSLINILS